MAQYGPSSRKRPTPISHYEGMTFWVVAHWKFKKKNEKREGSWQRESHAPSRIVFAFASNIFCKRSSSWSVYLRIRWLLSNFTQQSKQRVKQCFIKSFHLFSHHGI